MKRVAWLAVLLVSLGVARQCEAGVTPVDRMLRWIGLGWGIGYHAQTDTTGFSTLPGVRAPQGVATCPGMPYATMLEQPGFSPVEVISPREAGSRSPSAEGRARPLAVPPIR